MNYTDAKENYKKYRGLEEEKLLGFIAKNGIRKSALALKLSPAYICDIKHGRRKISDNVLSKLIEVLCGK